MNSSFCQNWILRIQWFTKSSLKKWKESFITRWTRISSSLTSNWNASMGTKHWFHLPATIHHMIICSLQCFSQQELLIAVEMLLRLLRWEVVEELGTIITRVNKVNKVKMKRCVAMVLEKFCLMSTLSNSSNKWTSTIITIMVLRFRELLNTRGFTINSPLHQWYQELVHPQ